MKLYVNMCMKLKRHKGSILFWKHTKISKKNIEKNLRDLFLFQYLRIYKDMKLKTFTTYKMFILKYFDLKSTFNKFAIWNCLFIPLTTMAHLTLDPKPALMKLPSLKWWNLFYDHLIYYWLYKFTNPKWHLLILINI
jgi:hypothetical protein